MLQQRNHSLLLCIFFKGLKKNQSYWKLMLIFCYKTTVWNFELPGPIILRLKTNLRDPIDWRQEYRITSNKLQRWNQIKMGNTLTLLAMRILLHCTIQPINQTDFVFQQSWSSIIIKKRQQMTHMAIQYRQDASLWH